MAPYAAVHGVSSHKANGTPVRDPLAKPDNLDYQFQSLFSNEPDPKYLQTTSGSKNFVDCICIVVSDKRSCETFLPHSLDRGRVL